MRPFDVVCVGVMLMDLPLGPIKGNLFAQETTMVENIALTTGGDALNEAVVLSRLGKRVALLGEVGQDLLGDLLIRRCEEEHIFTGGIERNPLLATRINVVLYQEDGQRSFVKSKQDMSGSLRPGQMDFSLMQGAGAVTLGSIFSSKLQDGIVIGEIVRQAKKHGALTFADMVPVPAHCGIDMLVDSFPSIDYFFANEKEMQMLTKKEKPEEAADVLLHLGVNQVVVKLGARGCLLKNKEICLEIPGLPAKTVDTTGAGDTFLAAFAAAVLEGKSSAESAAFANTAAALSTEFAGAVSGLKNKKQVEEYLRTIRF